MNPLAQGEYGLQQGEATLSYYETVLQQYSNSIAPNDAISDTGWLLLGAGALAIGLIFFIK
jgi:hypothetical protein